MIELTNWATQAVAKLEEGRKEIPAFNADEVTKKLRDSKVSQKQKDETVLAAQVSIVADAALDAMKNFSCQSEAFAKAVVEGGSLEDCVKSVMGGTVYAISDLDVYKKCAAYYFPDATIGMSLTINDGSVLSLKLDDFLL